MSLHFTCPTCQAVASFKNTKELLSRVLNTQVRNNRNQAATVRFWKHVDKISSPFGCWLWTGAMVGNGYGGFENMGAHRFSWILHNGPIPKGQLILHNCDVYYPLKSIAYRRCVKPEHIRPGTHTENMKDMFEKGRKRRITEKEKRELYSLSGILTKRELAKKFHISFTTLYEVLREEHSETSLLAIVNTDRQQASLK